MQADSGSVDNREGEGESRDGSQVKHQKLGSAFVPVKTDLMKF